MTQAQYSARNCATLAACARFSATLVRADREIERGGDRPRPAIEAEQGRRELARRRRGRGDQENRQGPTSAESWAIER